MRQQIYLIIIVIVGLFVSAVNLKDASGVNVRIKDIAYVDGIRENQLYGYGVVVGLSGTGDSQQVINFTTKILTNVFEKLGVIIENRQQNFISKNIAIVMVTANIPAFVKPGSKIDIVISTIGDAKSLKGGVLLQTAIQGADNVVYAVAQGPLSISGAENLAGEAQTLVKGVSTVATIPSGAIVEREIPFNLFDGKYIDLVLRDPDFTTSTRLVRAINNIFEDVSTSLSPGLVRVNVPDIYLGVAKLIGFIAQLEDISVTPDSIARIIINERTGTIVVSKDVRISTVAVAHGNLTITITESPQASQPSPFGGGDTTVIPKTSINIDEEDAHLMVVAEGASVHDVALSLNILGVSPRDLIAIFQAIKRAGALHAELVIM
ncbi:MAG: flagellar basal body P-ring protein FlgI [Candidatus Anammoxibacter sp.]